MVIDFSLLELTRYSGGSKSLRLASIMLDDRDGALLHIERRYDGRWLFDIFWIRMFRDA